MTALKIAENIKGHDLIQDQIRQALNTDRLAHALLFSGPSGVGKKEMAWSLAQNLLCDEDRSPCNSCSSCLHILKRQSENVLYIATENLQIRLQDVQTIPPFLSLQSFAKAKVVLMESAEKLNLQAGNFLLKIIEEPPPKSFFFLISSSPSKISLTLRSRLQNLRFQALPENVIMELSSEDTPHWMVRGSQGRMDLLEELKNQEDLRSLSFKLWSDVLKNSFSALILDFPNKISDRKSALLLCHFWQEILRDARFLKSDCPEKLIHGDKKKELEQLARFPSTILDLWIQEILKMEVDLRANADYILCFENFVIGMKKSLNV